MDIVINHLNVNSKHHDKHKFAIKFIPLQICSHYKLYRNVNIANFVYYGKTRLSSMKLQRKYLQCFRCLSWFCRLTLPQHPSCTDLVSILTSYSRAFDTCSSNISLLSRHRSIILFLFHFFINNMTYSHYQILNWYDDILDLNIYSIYTMRLICFVPITLIWIKTF